MEISLFHVIIINNIFLFKIIEGFYFMIDGHIKEIIVVDSSAFLHRYYHGYSNLESIYNGKRINVSENKTILEVAKKNNIDIATLCYLKECGHGDVCGVCLVEVEGEKNFHTIILSIFLIQKLDRHFVKNFYPDINLIEQTKKKLLPYKKIY